MPPTLKKILSPLASLKLTVVLMAMAIFLIFAGTWAQIDHGIWTVLEQYFRSHYVWIPLQIFLPRDWQVGGGIPFPGGYVIGLGLLINLLAAHSLRFKIGAKGTALLGGLAVVAGGLGLIIWFHLGDGAGQLAVSYEKVFVLLGIGMLIYAPLTAGVAMVFRKRCGIILIHAAIILLLTSESVTALFALETQMPIYEGQSINWAHDIREVEMAVIDHSHPEYDQVVAIDQAILQKAAKTGDLITHPQLPFSIKIEQFIPNSHVVSVTQNPSLLPTTTHGVGRHLHFTEVAELAGVGTDAERVDMPAAIVRLQQEGRDFGQYVISLHLQNDQFVFTGQQVEGAKTHQIYMRFRRYPRSYTITLDKFSHDLYPGTDTPKNFSSDIHLKDPATNEDRKIHIKMNHPLRYQGETFFQSGWIPGRNPNAPDRGTVLMVVRNPGWTIPYIACTIGAIGLICHFVLHLGAFLRRQLA